MAKAIASGELLYPTKRAYEDGNNLTTMNRKQKIIILLFVLYCFVIFYDFSNSTNFVGFGGSEIRLQLTQRFVIVNITKLFIAGIISIALYFVFKDKKDNKI